MIWYLPIKIKNLAHTSYVSQATNATTSQLYTHLIGLVIVFILILCYSKYSDYKAEQDAIALQEQREKNGCGRTLQQEESEPEPEPEPEEVKFEQPEIEVPEEVLATVQVTQIAIVDADKVKTR